MLGGFRRVVVAFAGHGDVPMGVEAMKKSAVDFLQKPAHDEALLQAIAGAVEHHAAARARQQEVARIQAGLAQLSPRERQVLEYVIGGCLNKQAAAELGIAERTVKIFRGNVMRKLDVDSVAELVRQCAVAGVVPRHARQDGATHGRPSLPKKSPSHLRPTRQF